MPQQISAGAVARKGTYRCTKCDAKLRHEAKGPLPDCPKCGNDVFKRPPRIKLPLVTSGRGR